MQAPSRQFAIVSTGGDVAERAILSIFTSRKIGLVVGSKAVGECTAAIISFS